MKHVRWMTALPLACVLALGGLTLAGCEREGPAEKAGERIDETAEDIGERMEEGRENLENRDFGEPRDQ